MDGICIRDVVSVNPLTVARTIPKFYKYVTIELSDAKATHRHRGTTRRSRSSTSGSADARTAASSHDWSESGTHGNGGSAEGLIPFLACFLESGCQQTRESFLNFPAIFSYNSENEIKHFLSLR